MDRLTRRVKDHFHHSPLSPPPPQFTSTMATYSNDPSHYQHLAPPLSPPAGASGGTPNSFLYIPSGFHSNTHEQQQPGTAFHPPGSSRRRRVSDVVAPLPSTSSQSSSSSSHYMNGPRRKSSIGIMSIPTSSSSGLDPTSSKPSKQHRNTAPGTSTHSRRQSTSHSSRGSLPTPPVTPTPSLMHISAPSAVDEDDVLAVINAYARPTSDIWSGRTLVGPPTASPPSQPSQRTAPISLPPITTTFPATSGPSSASPSQSPNSPNQSPCSPKHSPHPPTSPTTATTTSPTPRSPRPTNIPIPAPHLFLSRNSAYPHPFPSTTSIDSLDHVTDTEAFHTPESTIHLVNTHVDFDTMLKGQSSIKISLSPKIVMDQGTRAKSRDRKKTFKSRLGM